METIIIESKDKATTKRIKDFLKELKVSYTTTGKSTGTKNGKVKPYDPAFVQMVREASQEPGEKIIDPENIWESIKSS